MTLPLHKKRRTTVRSIHPAITPKMSLTVGMATLLCLLVFQGAARLTAEENPLDQLRDRSAETRWKSLRDRFSERRDERKDRRRHDEVEATPAGNSASIAEMEEQNFVPVPAPSSSEPVPPVAPKSREVRPAEQVPLLRPVPARSLEKTQGSDAPSAQPTEDLNSVARALEAAGPLYQEVFQLELTPVTSSMKSDDLQTVNTDLPHPGMLKASNETTTRGVAAQTVAMKETSTGSSMLMLPELPLPNAPPTDLRVAYQSPSPLVSPIPSAEKFIFSPDEYIKNIDEINPFSDYEPSAQQRNKDPYHNLCEHPLRSNSPASQCPEVALMPQEDDVYVKREFAHLEYAWVAPNICYNPLYFEDVNLERYGHIHNPVIQPFVSVGKFGTQFLGLPYQMVMKPPRMAVYPLGYLPPGDVCNPKLYYQIPFNAQAAMVTVGVYTGWFFLIP